MQSVPEVRRRSAQIFRKYKEKLLVEHFHAAFITFVLVVFKRREVCKQRLGNGFGKDVLYISDERDHRFAKDLTIAEAATRYPLESQKNLH